MGTSPGLSGGYHASAHDPSSCRAPRRNISTTPSKKVRKKRKDFGGQHQKNSKVRSDFGGTHKKPEATVQEPCVEWARSRDLLVVGSAVAQYMGGARAWKRLQDKGCEAGVADILILEGGVLGEHGLAVEFKAPGAPPPSDEQAAWLARAESKGWRCAVISSVPDFKKLVREYTGNFRARALLQHG